MSDLLAFFSGVYVTIAIGGFFLTNAQRAVALIPLTLTFIVLIWVISK